MEITFINPGREEILREILEFQKEGESSFWSEPLFYFYPQLDKTYADSLPFEERKNYIGATMGKIYTELEDTLNKKAELYKRCWQRNKDQITAALSEAFGVGWEDLFNDLRCHVSLNPIEPRFLKERRYTTFYLNSEEGAIGSGLHEIIHFLWFHVWNELFGDSYDEYERPSLKWILSEMVVEPIMRDPRLSTLNPYFPRERGGCVYPYFFDMEIGGRPILDTLDSMYRSQNIRDFMKSSYRYCREHEAEIREHIQKAEG